jgi:hypothetical protein
LLKNIYIFAQRHVAESTPVCSTKSQNGAQIKSISLVGGLVCSSESLSPRIRCVSGITNWRPLTSTRSKFFKKSSYIQSAKALSRMLLKDFLPTPENRELVKLYALDKKFGITTFPEQRQAIIEKYGLIG